MKKEKASSNYNTKQCRKRSIPRMAFKETITLFAVKKIG
jgi:hypothetical protein